MTQSIYLDLEPTTAPGLPDGGVTKSGIQYRKRPKDSGCLHGGVRYGTAHSGMVDVECKCGARWYEVKVVDVHFSERAQLYMADVAAREEEARMLPGERR